MRIEQVGGLGIGKSTLCRAFEDIGFNCIYENLKTNPFLADCFENPDAFRFPSQMWFVLSKYHEIRKFEIPGRVNVVDQAVMNVRAYTNMLFRNEDPAAMDIIERCFAYMEANAGAPDLLINLKCSPHEQMRRIKGRNREHEKGVTLEYITELQTEINILVNRHKANGHAVMTIDTEQVYLPGNTEYATRLARQIADMFHIDMSTLLRGKKRTEERPPLMNYLDLFGQAAE
jgi:deoxyadenosine/deoxycytidine kinase